MEKEQFFRSVKIITIKLVIALIIYFIISIFGILIFGFGTPLGWLISNYKLNNYSKAVYGEEVKPNGTLRYNFKNEAYSYKLTTKDGKTLTVRYNTSKSTIFDTLNQDKAAINLPNEIKAINDILGKDIYLPHPFIYCGIDGNQNFNQQPLKRKDMIYLTGIINTDVSLTPEQSKEKMIEIISVIYKNLGDKYNFTSSQIIYLDINGEKQIDISEKEISLPFAKIEHKIEELPSALVQKEIIRQLKDIKNGKLSKDAIILHPEV